jgi:hypothetical protein
VTQRLVWLNRFGYFLRHRSLKKSEKGILLTWKTYSDLYGTDERYLARRAYDKQNGLEEQKISTPDAKIYLPSRVCVGSIESVLLAPRAPRARGSMSQRRYV